MLLRHDERAHTLVVAHEIAARGWTHVVAPDAGEIRTLAAAGVDEEFVRHALDADEIARVDHRGDTTLVVLRVPWRASDDPGAPFRSIALGVIVDSTRVVTVCASDTGLGERASATIGLREGRGMEFLLRLVIVAADGFLACVRDIDELVSGVEARLSRSLANREVIELLDHQKSLVHLSTALESDRIMLERLAKSTRIGLDDEERDLLEDAMVELRQAEQQAHVAAETLGNLMDAFTSIISNNLNVVMKLLTSLTLVMTAPMLLISIYGMNVPLPGQSHPLALPAILGASVLTSIGVATFFRRKSWL